MDKSLQLIFWLLVGAFLVVLGEFFIPAFRGLFAGSKLFLLPLIIFSLLGGILIFFTLKKKVEGVFKKFLLLTGFSAAGFFVSVLFHNVFYSLGMVTEEIIILNYLMEGLHIAFFFIALIICPLGFLVGVIGSIAGLVRGRKEAKI